MWIEDEGRYVLDTTREHPTFGKLQQSGMEESHDLENALIDFKKRYESQYFGIDIFQKDRFIVHVDNGIPNNGLYKLVDADDNTLSKEYIQIMKCDGYCTVRERCGDGFLEGLIDPDGNEVMPCR